MIKSICDYLSFIPQVKLRNVADWQIERFEKTFKDIQIFPKESYVTQTNCNENKLIITIMISSIWDLLTAEELPSNEILIKTLLIKSININ